ncbi:gastrula zinc finger protein XlCGF57.1-like [Perca fluviatilis]|uniref:gastrula zinc finger protein XlCGF57.1-like n=1 Tax=Perca fluviatilis TaxID=8168 RepID=UPI00196264AA|nr:gastrula zinc finger protein XlCGF57.1-like [Perca fluviatilis]
MELSFRSFPSLLSFLDYKPTATRFRRKWCLLLFARAEQRERRGEKPLAESRSGNPEQRFLVCSSEMERHREHTEETKPRGEDLPPDVLEVIVGEEEQQECSSSVDQQEPEPPPHIKEEQEEQWSSQEGEQLQGLEEADITKFPFTPVPETEDSSDPETDDSADWKETREPQSPLNSLKKADKHLRCNSPEKPFSCSVCGKEFIKKGSLETHMRTHTGEKPFSCSVCGKKYPKRSNLLEHMGVHRGEKRQSCRLCNRRLVLHSGVECHQCVYPAAAGGRFKTLSSECDERRCSSTEQPETEDQTGDAADPEAADSADWKETREPQSALNSLKHDSRCKKTFSCSECGRRFGRKQHLKDHMKTHKRDRPFSCSVCKKSYMQSGSLQIHMRVHTGKRAFRCSECGNRFGRKTHLDDHMRIHTGEKPFRCLVCKKSFAQSGNLYKHMSTHRKYGGGG